RGGETALPASVVSGSWSPGSHGPGRAISAPDFLRIRCLSRAPAVSCRGNPEGIYGTCSGWPSLEPGLDQARRGQRRRVADEALEGRHAPGISPRRLLLRLPFRRRSLRLRSDLQGAKLGVHDLGELGRGAFLEARFAAFGLGDRVGADRDRAVG